MSQAQPSDPEGTRQLATLASTLVDRQRFATSSVREIFDGDRDFWKALGYPEDITYEQYLAWYRRGDIAGNIIDKPASTTWSESPTIIDDAHDEAPEAGSERTDFERDVAGLFDAIGPGANLERGLRHYLERADKLARIGQYGVIFLGFSDATTFDRLADPVRGSNNDLLYLTPLGEGDAKVEGYVDDPTNPRNGRPERYTLRLRSGGETRGVIVHHTRVIHIAEGVLDDEDHGEPALERVINRLIDTQKIAGSCAEAYWMLANPGLALSVDPDFQDVPTEKMDAQVEEYEHNLRRVLKLFGVDVEQIDGQDVNPEKPLEAQLKLIAGSVGIPQRKLIGSERGELASTQDEVSYVEGIVERQHKFAEPVILRPLLDRLIEFGVIRPPSGATYTVEWPNLFQLTDLEEAELRKTQAQTVKQLAPRGDPTLLHSVEALREFSPLEESGDAPHPEGVPEPEGVEPEVIEEFDRPTAD